MGFAQNTKNWLRSALVDPAAFNDFVKVPQGIAADYVIARGSSAVTGTAAITTGLTTIVGFSVTLGTDPAHGTAMWVSGAISGGTLTLKTWKPTGTGDVTAIAGTGTPTVYWIAVGTV